MITAKSLIEQTNLSSAWVTALDLIVHTPGTEISPLILTLKGFDETNKIRNLLDGNLKKNKLDSIATVSETIFPNALYQFCKYNRFELYEEYSKILPRLKKVDARNSRGTYFERLTAFQGSKNERINQLEIILSALKDKTGIRRSKLQASIFDPRHDHTNAQYQGFPCLQHVTFYKSETGGLVVNSFYAIQYLYQRAYGNWLGLVNLGKFMAKELGTNLDQFNCFISIEKLDRLTKNQAGKLLSSIKS